MGGNGQLEALSRTSLNMSTAHPTEARESGDDVQQGVKNIEAVSRTWSKWGLIVAYIGIFLMAFTTSLEQQVSYSMSTFATSSFNTHSLLATVTVIQGVVMAVNKPIMAKISNVLGRLEAFSFAVLLYVLGYIQQAASKDINTFASAQIFYAAGNTGTQILQQIFIADTSDLLWRAFFSSLPDIPFLVTVWVGPEITNSLVGKAFETSYRWPWGYAIWAIVLPVAFIPLASSLFINQRKARKLGLIQKTERPPKGPILTVLDMVAELDIIGILLLSAAFALILIPLTIASRQEGGWANDSMIAMVVVGAICFIVFPFWESSALCPHPLIPMALLRSRTFCAGCLIAFFYFMAFYLSVFPYYYSYLLVVQRLDAAVAGRVTQVFSFSSTVTSVLVGLAIKYTRHYKYFVTAGASLYLLGIGLMLQYRREDASMAALVGTQVCIGIGGGMLNVPAQLGVQAASSHQSVAAATAVFLTVLELGGAVGAAISGAVWTRVVPETLFELLPEASKGNASAIFGSVTTAAALEWGSPERLAVNAAYQAGMTRMVTIAACVCAPIVVLSLMMRNIKLDEVEQGVKGRVIGGRVGEADTDRERESERAREGGEMGEGTGGSGSAEKGV